MGGDIAPLSITHLKRHPPPRTRSPCGGVWSSNPARCVGTGMRLSEHRRNQPVLAANHSRPHRSALVIVRRAGACRIHRQDLEQGPFARDIAALVSVADNAEPLFAACQRDLPPLRALVHVQRASAYPHSIASPGQAADIAMTVQQGLRTVRRDYGNIGTIHLFMAAPAGLAVLVGQLLNTFGAIQPTNMSSSMAVVATNRQRFCIPALDRRSPR